MSTKQGKSETGIVLAGGKSSRLGRDKAKETVGEVSLIQRVVAALSEVCGEILVIGREPGGLDEVNGVKIKMVQDALPGRGPLMGLYSGLSAANHPYAILVACDAPFLAPALLNLLVDLVPGHEAVVPLINEIPQPTTAAYSKSILPKIEEALKLEGSGLRTLLAKLEVMYVAEEQLKNTDPGLLSFMNINTEDDLEAARRIHINSSG